MHQIPKILISIVGPTAVGKTSLAIRIAQHLKSEIVSVDSRQMYREMKLGTAKPTLDELAQVPHHFIDTLSIHNPYSVGDFEREGLAQLGLLFEKYDQVVAVGGSGLFFKALWEGFDEMPEVAPNLREKLVEDFEVFGLAPLLEELREADPDYYERVDRKNPHRIIRALEVIRSSGKPFSHFRKDSKKTRPFSILKIGLEMERELLYRRIDQRMDLMIAAGLFEEAASFFEFRKLNALQTVGYTEIFDFLEGKYDRDEAVRLLKQNSRRYAKRQMTWFKRDPEIKWVQPDQESELMEWLGEKIKYSSPPPTA